MKIMVFGTWDREDGGLMCPSAFIIPDDIVAHEDALNWLKTRPDFLPKLLKDHCEHGCIDGEYEVELLQDEFESIEWKNYRVEIHFTKIVKEDGEDVEHNIQFILDVDSMKLHKV
jgi:hypothetical protein